MSRTVRHSLGWLLVVWLLIGMPLELAAQRPPTIAAAANLNFALTEIAEQFERAQGTRVELVFGASGTLTRQIQDGAPFEMFLAADEEFPNQLSAAGLTRDAGVVYAVGRLVIFAPTGSPLMVDERLDGLARLVKAGGVAASPSPIPTSPRTVAPRKPCCGNAGCGTRFARTWCSATPSRRPRSSRRPATPWAASSPTRWCSSPGFADRGTLRRDSRRRSSAASPAHGAARSAPARSPHGSTPTCRATPARAILRKHGFAVPE